MPIFNDVVLCLFLLPGQNKNCPRQKDLSEYKIIVFGKDEYANSVIVNSDIDLKGKIKLTEINNGNHITLNGNIDKKNKEDFAA